MISRRDLLSSAAALAAGSALLAEVASSQDNSAANVADRGSDLAAFNSLETAAGYIFNSDLLAADTPVLRVSFAIVPEPTSLALAGLGIVGVLGLCFKRQLRR